MLNYTVVKNQYNAKHDTNEELRSNVDININDGSVTWRDGFQVEDHGDHPSPSTLRSTPLTGSKPVFEWEYSKLKQVIALKDVGDVSPIHSLILGLGWVLWSTGPRLKETH